VENELYVGIYLLQQFRDLSVCVVSECRGPRIYALRYWERPQEPGPCDRGRCIDFCRCLGPETKPRCERWRKRFEAEDARGRCRNTEVRCDGSPARPFSDYLTAF
jgi:hypothetical protein